MIKLSIEQIMKNPKNEKEFDNKDMKIYLSDTVELLDFFGIHKVDNNFYVPQEFDFRRAYKTINEYLDYLEGNEYPNSYYYHVRKKEYFGDKRLPYEAGTWVIKAINLIQNEYLRHLTQRQIDKLIKEMNQ